MDIGKGVAVEDELLRELVLCGRRGHELAQAHHNDPGSNGFTFGTDRYQRATELSADVLRRWTFDVRRRGAGLVAVRGPVQLEFAVARGNDLTDPASFDADSSPARRRAGLHNRGQSVLDGMPEPDGSNVVHLVWSGNVEAGLTAVHVGRLVLSAGDRLDWAVLVRIDETLAQFCSSTTGAAAPVPGYADQPVPALTLEPRVTAVGARPDVSAASDEA